MHIREAKNADAKCIGNIYLKAFDKSEAQEVSNVAIGLLNEQHPVNSISLVAIDNNKLVGHIAFSPVFLERDNTHIGYILAPLAVTPAFQNTKIGSSLVQHGLQIINKMGSFIVFVYGDPRYYNRFGFNKTLADIYTPPYTLQYPEGWQALKLASPANTMGGNIVCVDTLNDPDLW